MNIEEIKSQFPILSTQVYGKDLVYLDNGATTQKPQSVIDNISHYYQTMNSNVHRGVHYLSQTATDALELSRQKISDFINAPSSDEIIFTKGTTDSINLVAFSYGEEFVHEGDEIIVTEMEHHSNIVPWYMLCKRKNAKLKYIPLLADGTLDMAALPSLITPQTKLIALTWVSNSLGTVNPIQEIVALAHQHHIPVLVDAAQAVQHLKVDVQAMDIDFLVASGHKMYAATGVGFLYGKRALLTKMPPYQGGGSMIQSVSMEEITYGDIPFRFEAGTPDIAGEINMGAAIDFINSIGIEAIGRHEGQIMDYAIAEIQKIDRVHILGNPAHRAGAISLTIDNAHPYDIGELLDKQGVAVRTGHHCCQPIMDKFAIPGTLRLSMAVYNNEADIQAFIKALKRALTLV